MDIFQEDNDDLLSEGEVNHKKPFTPDLTLSTAIRNDTIKFVVEKFNQPDTIVPRDIEKVVSVLRNWVPDTTILSHEVEYIYGVLLAPAENPDHCSYDVKEYHKLATNSANAMKKTFCEVYNSSIKDKSDLSKKSNKLPNEKLFSLSDMTLKHLTARLNWTKIRDVMYVNQLKDDLRIKRTKLIHNMEGFIIGSFLFLKYNDVFYVLSYHHVLMMVDTMCERFLSLGMCDIYTLCELNTLPSTNNLMSIYSYGDTLFPKYGNTAFKILSCIESACTGIQLKYKEKLSLSRGFFEQTIEDEPDDIREECKRLFDVIYKAQTNSNQLFEIFGCYRHFGHPTVDEEEGCKALKEVTRVKPKVDSLIAKQAAGGLIKTFVVNFIRKHGRWPNCRPTEDAEEAFQVFVRAKPLSINDFSKSFTIQMWADIDFDKEFEFDYFEDFTEILSDKSISPSKEAWYSVFDKTQINDNWAKVKVENRRVLTEMLNHPDLNIKKIMQRIMNHDIPDKWFVVGLHSKEREMKIKSRLFAMMVLEMRIYFAASEANISKNIFPYIPHQTMTMTESELVNHIMKISKRTDDQKVVKIIMSIDFSKWNWRQGFECNERVFRFFEQLMGVPELFNFTHKFFQRSWFYLSSRFHPPSFMKTNDKNKYNPHAFDTYCEVEDNCVWWGQYGGCEGLRQKGWTATTIGVLIALEHLTGVRATITGQGDNQVLVLEFPILDDSETPDEYIRRNQTELEKRIFEYQNELERMVTGMGWKLKRSETWVSSHLMNYGKEILVSGMYLTAVLKKGSRMFGDTSDSYPNLSSRLASICSTAHSTCAKSICHIPHLWWMYYEMAIILQKEIHDGILFKDRLKRIVKNMQIEYSVDLLLFIMNFSNNFGGFPVMNPMSIVYRGHPDPITSDIEWINLLSKQFKWARNLRKWMVSGDGFQTGKIDYVYLVEDPTALNFKRPITPTNHTQRVLQSKIIGIAKNPQVRKLLIHLDKSEEIRFLNYLMKIQPVSPRVLNEIMRHTPYGAAKAFVATFTEMRTTKNMLTATETKMYLDGIENTEILWFTFVCAMYLKILKDAKYNSDKYLPKDASSIKNHLDCSTCIAQYLRDASWKVKVHHVTTPHPYHQFKLTMMNEAASIPIDVKEHILYLLEKPVNILDGCKFIKVGSESPYLGSRTQEKRSSQLLPMKKSDRSFTSVAKLARLIGWVCPKDSNLGLTIRNIIRSRSDMEEATIIMVAGINFGGSLQHRFDDVRSQHASHANIRLNISTLSYYSTDTMGKYSSGGKNYPLHYQGTVLMGMVAIHHQIFLYDSNDYGGVFVIQEINCEDCLYDIDESYLDAPQVPPFQVKSAKGCDLIYNTTKNMFDDLDPGPLKLINKVSPNAGKMYPTTWYADSVAWVVLSESTEQLRPIIFTHQSLLSKEHHTSRISLASFLKVDIVQIIKSFCKIWIADRYHSIVFLQKQYGGSLLEAALSLLSMESQHLWSTVRLILLHKEVWSRLLSILDVTPASSESYRSYIQLDSFLIRILAKQVRRIFEEREFAISLFAPVGLMNYNRIARCWINSILISIGEVNNIPPKFLTGKMRYVLAQTATRKLIDPSSFLDSLNKFNQDYPGVKLPDVKGEYKFNLSAVGAEAWTKVDVSPSLTLSNQVAKPVALQAEDWKNIRKSPALKILKTIPVTRVMTHPKNQTFPTQAAHITKSYDIKLREDHQYRLTGCHSTAHYKYAALYKYAKLETARSSMHLAEGAGGVASFTSLALRPDKVIYNSLIPIQEFPPQRAVHYMPAALQSINPHSEIFGVKDALATGGDLNDPKVIHNLIMLGNQIGDIDLVTCDAETSGNFDRDESINIAMSVARILFGLKDAPTVVFKTFCEIPSILYAQIQIFLSLSGKVEILVPNYSSHECYECFIMFKVSKLLKKYPQLDISWTNDDIELLERLQVLSQTRLQDRPLQAVTPKEDHVTLSEMLNDLGMTYNLCVCITSLTRSLIDTDSFVRNPLKSLFEAFHLVHNQIVERMRLIGVISDLGLRKESDLIKHGFHTRESSQIMLKAEVLFNLKILIAILYNKAFLLSTLDQDIKVYYKGQCLFTYTVDPTDWCKKHIRHVQKILGFLRYKCVSL